MNKKELNEIRRRFKPDYDNISQIFGCYVNAGKQIVSEIDLPVGRLSDEEAEMYLKVLKKTLSGTLGRNLIDIGFSTDQVDNSDEHKLLQALRQSHLNDPGLRNAFYQRVIESLDPGETGYVILLASDSYDIPYKGSDGETFDEGSAEVFDYYLCCVCPVKDPKAQLTYHSTEKSFRESVTGVILTQPALGFMFPCFDDRTTNIYDLLYYSRSLTDIHDEFIQGMFGVDRTPMSAGEQKASFGSALTGSLGEDCSLDVVVALHENIRERLEEHKETNQAEPPEIYVSDMDQVLRNNGVPAKKIESFNDSVEEAFGELPTMNPDNLVETKKFHLETAGVKIQVDPDYISTIKTDVVDGKKYIMIPAVDRVEINGIAVAMGDDEAEDVDSSIAEPGVDSGVVAPGEGSGVDSGIDQGVDSVEAEPAADKSSDDDLEMPF